VTLDRGPPVVPPNAFPLTIKSIKINYKLMVVHIYASNL
jgi:hypothetical protein